MIMEAGRKAAKPPLEAFPVKILPHRTQGGSLALIHAAQHPVGLLKVITLSANTEHEPRITPGIESVRKQYDKQEFHRTKSIHSHTCLFTFSSSREARCDENDNVDTQDLYAQMCSSHAG